MAKKGKAKSEPAQAAEGQAKPESIEDVRLALSLEAGRLRAWRSPPLRGCDGRGGGAATVVIVRFPANRKSGKEQSLKLAAEADRLRQAEANAVQDKKDVVDFLRAELANMEAKVGALENTVSTMRQEIEVLIRERQSAAEDAAKAAAGMTAAYEKRISGLARDLERLEEFKGKRQRRSPHTQGTHGAGNRRAAAAAGGAAGRFRGEHSQFRDGQAEKIDPLLAYFANREQHQIRVEMDERVTDAVGRFQRLSNEQMADISYLSGKTVELIEHNRELRARNVNIARENKLLQVEAAESARRVKKAEAFAALQILRATRAEEELDTLRRELVKQTSAAAAPTEQDECREQSTERPQTVPRSPLANAGVDFKVGTAPPWKSLTSVADRHSARVPGRPSGAGHEGNALSPGDDAAPPASTGVARSPPGVSQPVSPAQPPEAANPSHHAVVAQERIAKLIATTRNTKIGGLRHPRPAVAVDRSRPGLPQSSFLHHGRSREGAPGGSRGGSGGHGLVPSPRSPRAGWRTAELKDRVETEAARLITGALSQAAGLSADSAA
ncbi:MAG: hypothetical protein BJ554DRAFT_7267 [Olpidium bornovanus]|uniref:Uncharacterized protein n=1 Tax=Olpidium bornovanus TaxID=278681 RepID=A0A8H7ZX58_9FUNG|nr:MAG: hypothetical protein BJ554DRAFT_7267 [Olpidium bornovanus]